MTVSTPQEQLMLELINRARMNPVAEATRLGVTLDAGQSTPKAILAMNSKLVVASDRHSNWMLANDQFDHQESAAYPSGRTGLNPGDRMTAAGYSFTGSWASGENISYRGPASATANIIDQHADLFRSDGHRANILHSNFREMGVGQQIGDFDGFNVSMVTQSFAKSGNTVFVSGALYNDNDGDYFYDVGEQVAGRRVSGTGGVTDTSGAGGGYALGFASTGTKSITFDMADHQLSLSVNVASSNLKIDVVSGTKIWTNASVTTNDADITEMRALGGQSVNLTAGAGNQVLVGNGAANVLNGGAGNDRFYGAAGNDTLNGGAGNDLILGSAGNDVLTGGANADTFFFNTAPGTTNRDTITDFSVADDTIRLENGIFAALTTTGTLASSAFAKNAAGTAVDSNDRIIYDTDGGWLIYDSNGSAAGGSVIFGKVAAGLAMTASDFVVV